MLQTGGEQLVREIHKLCNKAWKEGTIPDDLSDKSHGKSTASRAATQQ
ncbi:unnamed protein product, partial [Rotaria magnacalcarata]